MFPAFLLLLPVFCGALDFSFLSDKDLLISTTLGAGSTWAEGPFSCATVVSRKCAALGPTFAAAPCGYPLSEDSPALPAPVPHADGYNRSFLFFGCAQQRPPPDAAPVAPLSSRGSVLAQLSRGSRGSDAAARSRVWAEPLPHSAAAAAAAVLPAAAAARSSPCVEAAATRVVCAQTAPREGGVSGGSSGGGGASAPWGSRCTCLLRSPASLAQLGSEAFEVG